MTTPNNPENSDNAKNPFSSDSTSNLPSYGEATANANEERAHDAANDHDANNYGVDNTAHDHASHDAYGTNATAAGAGCPAYAGADSQPAKKNAVAIWALVIGIIALLSLLLIVPPLLLGPIGIIVSIIALVWPQAPEGAAPHLDVRRRPDYFHPGSFWLHRRHGPRRHVPR